MSERKLYFTGLGGNRYEVTHAELQKLAFTGKIRRDDELILWEKSDDGQATERKMRCSKVKGLEDYFARGEFERLVAQAEREQEREERLQEKQEKAEAELAERTQQRLEKAAAKEQERKREKYFAGELALARVKYLIRTLTIWPAALALGLSVFALGLLFIIWILALINGDSSEAGDALATIVQIITGDVFICLLMCLVYWIVMVPVWLIEYCVETMRHAIIDAARIRMGEEIDDEKRFVRISSKDFSLWKNWCRQPADLAPSSTAAQTVTAAQRAPQTAAPAPVPTPAPAPTPSPTASKESERQPQGDENPFL